MPNYSPIPAIGNTAPQQPTDVSSGASVPTSMPRPQGGSWFNTSDPTYNRGKAKIINSFTDPQEPQEQEKNSSKGGKKRAHKVLSLKINLSWAPVHILHQTIHGGH